MAEVTTRGGALPRGLPQRARGRGRGRGRGGSHSTAESQPPPNGLEHRVNGHRASDKYPANPDEPEELKTIRKKHGHNLATIKELFPNWTDEDLLMALNEAAGDLELAAARISEGLTEQWGSVKTKKDKKLSSPVIASSQYSRTQSAGTAHAHDGRPGRGRSDAPRGSPRGGGRGAAPRGVGRGQFTTAPARSAPAATEDASNAWTTPTTWGAAASASDEPIDTSDAPTALPSEVGPSADTWQSSFPQSQDPQGVNNQTTNEMLNGTTEPSKWIPQSHKKPASRVITPGTKMSWAQVARPIEPPKTQIPPTPSAPPPGPHPIPTVADGQANAAPQAEPTETIAPLAAANPQLHDGQVAINIPDSTADVWHTEPVPAIDDLKANLAGAGPNVWNDDPVLQPLGVGEGWAEAVLAQPSESKASIFDHQTANQMVITPSDSANIGPIELSTPPATVSTLEPPSVAIPPSANVVDRAIQAPEAASILGAASQQPNSLPSAPSSILAPPGLTKRTSTRKGQEAAVVMPGSGTPTVDRMGLKFGSLSLFGDATETGDALQAAPRDAPSPPATVTEEAYSKDAGLKPDDSHIEKALTPPQPNAEPVKAPSPPGAPQAVEEQPAPPQLIHSSTQPAPSVQHVQPNPPTPASVQATQPPSSTFSSRYPSNNQYTTADPAVVQQSNASSQAPQQQQHQQDAFSHYPGFRQDPMAAYFQQQQQPQQSAISQHSPSPAPASQSSAAYGTFNHMNQQVPQQSQQPAQNAFGQAPQSAQDYAAIYGQEALRSLGYYDTYAHAQAAQAPQASFPSRSPHGGADDSAKSAVSAQSIPPPSQPQQVGLHQHHHQPQQPQQQQQQQPAGSSVSTTNQQYPGMQPSPMPYPYYPYYQQYGQLPPNYQNPAYPYALQGPSPYYSVQGSQQYQAGNTRAGQSQYPMQGGPGSSVAAVPNSLPLSHGHQPQHASQHGLGGVGAVANNAGFRQVSQPGAGTSQIPVAQASGQGIMTGNSGLVASGGNSGMPPSQQPSSMHQQHAYYATGYGGYAADPQQTHQGAGGMSGSTNTGGHHHHHQHQAQQQHVTRQSGHHQHHHHGGVQGHVGGVPAGASGGGGQGTNERKDPFNFSSDRFFNQ